MKECLEMSTFPEQLRFHRARLRISQPRMAEILEVGERTYCGWERDDDPKRKPHVLMREGALHRLMAIPTPQP